MKNALWLASLLLVPAAPALACGDRVRLPSDMREDARVKSLVQRMLAAQELWEKTRKELFAAAEKDPAYVAAQKAYEAVSYDDPARKALEKEFNALRDRLVWDRLTTAVPVRVRHNMYLCGSTRLDCGHSINAGSSWTIRDDSRPELDYFSLPGAEMHMAEEHGQASAWTLSQLEKFLEKAPRAAVMTPARETRIRAALVQPAF